MHPDPISPPPPDQSTEVGHEQASGGDGRITLDAALLKSLRKSRALTQEALAELCFARQLPVSIASIKRAETGKAVLYRTARHLASILGAELDALLAQPELMLAAAPATPPTLPAPAAQHQSGADVRYVIELHLLLAAPLLGEALDLMAAIVTRFGGTLRQADSANPVALFGLPQAFRSDGERSVRCALALRAALLVHGARALSVGIARWSDGAAQASIPGPRAPGPDTDRLSPPIHVARSLAHQLRSQFRFEQSAAAWLGLAGPNRAAAQLALSGRLAETRQFKALAEAMHESGAEVHASHVVYLRAMAGVGKTRLAAEFAEMARAQGFSCHRGHVQDAGAEGWRAPLSELARSLVDANGAGDEPADGELEQAIGRALHALALAPESEIFVRALCGARMQSAQLSLYAAMSHAVRERGLADALAALVTRRAARAPLLLILEDVHWGDSHLFDAFGELLEATRAAPVIWLLTSRLEHDPFDASLRAHLYELPVTVFDLAPLPARDAQALAGQYPDLDAAFRQRCVERAQGNALFLTQLLASPDHALPDSLKHLVQARLDLLPPMQRRALRTAAVIGNRFELALLRQALGEPGYQLDAAGRHALVRKTGADTAAFVHDLVMHCIYDAIAPEERRRLHRSIAGLYRDHDPAVSAQHLYRANDPAAFEMMLRAIRDRLAGHEYEAALELTDQCSAHDSTRYSSFTLALLKAHATAGLGLSAQARLAYQHALMLAGRPQEKIDAVIGLAGTLNILEELDEEERLLDETLPLARSIDAGASLARLLYLKGNIYFPRGNYAECRRYHEDAVRHARASGASDTEARALSGVGDSFYAQGCMNQAQELFAHCIAMCEQHGLIGIEASNRAALGSTRLYLGKPAQAIADALHSADLAHRVGNRRAEVFSRMTAGWVLVATGALDEAEAQVEQAMDMARSIGAARFETFLMESGARIAWQRGEHALARRQIGAAAERVDRLQLRGFIGPWVLGTLALFTDDAAVRQRALLQGAAYLTRDCLAHNGFRFFVSAAEVALLNDDLVAAQFYAEQLELSAGSDPCAWTRHHAAVIRAFAAHRTAPRAATRAALAALEEQGRGYGFMFTTPRLCAALAAQ
jgi:predicted ATPase/transcriptional regulator with XRE-family HTH domain